MTSSALFRQAVAPRSARRAARAAALPVLALGLLTAVTLYLGVVLLVVMSLLRASA